MSDERATEKTVTEENAMDGSRTEENSAEESQTEENPADGQSEATAKQESDATDQPEQAEATDQRDESAKRDATDEEDRATMHPRSKASLLWGVVGLLAFLVLMQGYELWTGFRYSLAVKAGAALLVGVGATGLSYVAEPRLFG